MWSDLDWNINLKDQVGPKRIFFQLSLLSGLLLPLTKGIEFILSFQIKEYLRQEILQLRPPKISATAKIMKILIGVAHNACQSPQSKIFFWFVGFCNLWKPCRIKENNDHSVSCNNYIQLCLFKHEITQESTRIVSLNAKGRIIWTQASINLCF